MRSFTIQRSTRALSFTHFARYRLNLYTVRNIQQKLQVNHFEPFEENFETKRQDKSERGHASTSFPFDRSRWQQNKRRADAYDC